MFLNLPVIHSVHGGLDAGGESTSKGVGHTPTIGNYGIRSTSGRYVWYWNAFLLIWFFLRVGKCSQRERQVRKSEVSRIRSRVFLPILSNCIWRPDEDDHQTVINWSVASHSWQKTRRQVAVHNSEEHKTHILITTRKEKSHQHEEREKTNM